MRGTICVNQSTTAQESVGKMATHAGADSDMSIVYFSLTINDKKKIRKAEKS